MMALVLLGISLAIKHDLLLFPLWLALRSGTWQERWYRLSIPYAIFTIPFVPWILAGSGPAIWHDVVLYQGFANAPLWHAIIPGRLLEVIPPSVWFLGAMLLMGLAVRELDILSACWVYLIALVVFASTLANQYLIILLPALAVRWDRWACAYTVVATVFLLSQSDGLHLPALQTWLPASGEYVAAWHRLLIGVLIVHLGRRFQGDFYETIPC